MTKLIHVDKGQLWNGNLQPEEFKTLIRELQEKNIVNYAYDITGPYQQSINSLHNICKEKGIRVGNVPHAHIKKLLS